MFGCGVGASLVGHPHSHHWPSLRRDSCQGSRPGRCQHSVQTSHFLILSLIGFLVLLGKISFPLAQHSCSSNTRWCPAALGCSRQSVTFLPRQSIHGFSRDSRAWCAHTCMHTHIYYVCTYTTGTHIALTKCTHIPQAQPTCTHIPHALYQ